MATRRCVEVDLREVDLSQVGTTMNRVIGWNGLGWSYGRTVGTTRSDFDAALQALSGILDEWPAVEVPCPQEPGSVMVDGET